MYRGVVPKAAGPREAEDTPSTNTLCPRANSASDLFPAIESSLFRKFGPRESCWQTNGFFPRNAMPAARRWSGGDGVHAVAASRPRSARKVYAKKYNRLYLTKRAILASRRRARKVGWRVWTCHRELAQDLWQGRGPA